MHRPGIIGARPHHGGTPYVGPLDIVPGAIFAVGQRAMSAALRGTALYTIADGAGGATLSFNSDATTGNAPTSAIEFYSATPFVSLWNDQSGNAYDVLQADASIQPNWTAAGPNAKPGIVFFGDSDALAKATLEAAAVSFTGTGFTSFVIYKKPAAAGDQNFIPWRCGDAANGPYAYHGVVTNTDASGDSIATDRADLDFENEAGAFSNEISPEASFVLDDVANVFGDAATLFRNSVAQTVNGYTDFGSGPVNPFTGDLYVGYTGNGCWLNGTVAEIIVYPTILSAPSRLAIRQNIAAYYGILLS